MPVLMHDKVNSDLASFATSCTTVQFAKPLTATIPADTRELIEKAFKKEYRALHATDPLAPKLRKY